MSVKEVNQLRKDGRLDDAYRMADSDLKLEQSEWTYSAMFWVIRDYCNLYIGQRNYEFVSVCINKMHDILANMQDYEGVAKKALKTIEKKSDPHYDEIANLAEMSKNGEEEIAYNRICALHEVSPLANLFHEDYGWIIFRYLKKCYESCGSLNARKALFRYINLENSRPSILHSQILSIATLISEKYEDFKFLPFLDFWNIKTLNSEDFQTSEWNGKEIRPLVERIIERCFKLGYSIKETKDAFTKNPQISEFDVFKVYSRIHFFEINKSKNENNTFYTIIRNYFTSVRGFQVCNEFHSKILSLYLWKLPESPSNSVVSDLDMWGLGNFRDDDWRRETKDDTEYPSLVEKAIKGYYAGLKAIQFNQVNDSFISLLNKACEKYDDDQIERYLAIVLLEKGEKEKTLLIYRKLLLKQNSYYIWKELAEATDNKELKLSAYCKAVLSESQDEFLGDIHLALAKIMIDMNRLSNAKRELQTYYDTYRGKGWNLKGDYYILNSLVSLKICSKTYNL